MAYYNYFCYAAPADIAPHEVSNFIRFADKGTDYLWFGCNKEPDFALYCHHVCYNHVGIISQEEIDSMKADIMAWQNSDYYQYIWLTELGRDAQSWEELPHFFDAGYAAQVIAFLDSSLERYWIWDSE